MNMKKRIVIECVKYASAVTIGAVIGAVTRPAVKDFFKITKKSEPDTIPAVDIEEEDVTEEE